MRKFPHEKKDAVILKKVLKQDAKLKHSAVLHVHHYDTIQ